MFLAGNVYLNLWVMLVLCISSTVFAYDRYGWESGFKNYHKWHCELPEQVDLRGPASTSDINLKNQNSFFAPMTEAFGKEYERYKLKKQYEKDKKRFHFFTQDKAKTIDFNRDGVADCKRVYYKKSKQIREERCDFNHDGVLDSVERYSRNGLKLYEGSNSDSDSFFEIEEVCKFTSKARNHAKCVRRVDYTGSNTYDHSRTYYVADTTLKLKRTSKKPKRKVASIRPTNEQLDLYEAGPVKVTEDWLTKDGPISDNLLPVQKDFVETLRNNYVIDSPHYRQVADYLEKEWDKPTTTRADKFFMSIRGYEPRIRSCVSEAPAYCKQANYKKMGLGKNQKTYEMCLIHTYHSCREEKTTEAALCFDCLSKADGKKLNEMVWEMLKPVVGDFREECGEEPPRPEPIPIPDEAENYSDAEIERFFKEWDRKTEANLAAWHKKNDIYKECVSSAKGAVPDKVAEDSPKGFYKSELFGFLIHEDCLDELKTDSFGDATKIETKEDLMRMFNEMVASSFQCFDGGDNPQSWFQTRRLLRAFKPDLYSKFNAEIGLTGNSELELVPENYKPDSSRLDCDSVEGSCDYIGPEYDHRVKFVCVKNMGGERSSGGQKNYGATFLDEESIEKGFFLGGPRIKIDWNKDLNSRHIDGIGHYVSHAVLGNAHGHPRQQADGKWVCKWNPEIDYAQACNWNLGEKAKRGLKGPACEAGCTSFPTSHLKPNGDYTDEYLKVLDSEEHRKGGVDENGNFYSPVVESRDKCATY